MRVFFCTLVAKFLIQKYKNCDSAPLQNDNKNTKIVTVLVCRLITKIPKYKNCDSDVLQTDNKNTKKNCDSALLQTGCLGVPEFLHQLQLQTQVGNGERKRKTGENNGERKNGENNAVRKRKMGEHNGKEKWEGGN